MQKVDILLRESNLNWKVNPFRLAPIDQDLHLKTNYYGLFRDDNKMNLGVVKERYILIQNRELANVFMQACDGITDEFKAGSFGNGEKVFFLGELPTQDIGGVEVQRYITLFSSHDGNMSIKFGNLHTNLNRHNQFFLLSKELQSFSHANIALNKVSDLAATINNLVKLDVRLIDNLKRFADIKFDDNKRSNIINKVLGIKNREKIRYYNFIDSWNNEFYLYKNTKWGALNAITHYTTRKLNHKDGFLNNIISKIHNNAYEYLLEN